MDHKSWPWKKKSSEKTILETDKVNNLSLNGNEEEIQKLLVEKAEVENDLKNVNEKLSSVLADSNAKDDLMKKHENMAQEAIVGWEETKAEAASLKRKLDEALCERVKGKERVTYLDASLKECMQQLLFVRDEQEQRIHDAVTKTSKEYEKDMMILEKKLAETSKRLAEADAENTHLTTALLAKNNMIEDLNRQMTQAEADIKALMKRLESREKDNSSLKYEIRVLEKELEIRNEEREFNRRTAEASHKQHLENVRKLAKLESECQRLRLLVRKRLPGPAALAKMKTEVEILGRDSIEMRRKLNASPSGMLMDSERMNHLTEQLCLMEEENKTLREALSKKINELQFSRSMYSRTASKLLEVESHLEESSKGHTNMEPSWSSNVSHEVSLASISNVDNDDKVSCAESWASALISELEHFKNKKEKGSISSKAAGASEMTLMDDFAEMEKLALVSVDNPPSSSPVSSAETNAVVDLLEIGSNENSLEVTGKEIIPLSDCPSSSSAGSLEIKSGSIDKLPCWLQDIMRVAFEHKDVAQRNPDAILEDIRQALSSINQPSSNHFVDMRKGPNHQAAPYPLDIENAISLKPSERSILVDTPRGEPDADLNLQSDLAKPIRKIIKVVEGITLQSPAYDIPEMPSLKDERYLSYKNSKTPSGYTVRVLQWKTLEPGDVLQQFLHTCYDLLNGKADINRFAQDLSSAMDWIVNHCFSLQDVSSMREEIKKHFGWDETRNESEAEFGVIGEVSDADKLHLPRERFSSLSTVVASNSHDILFQKEVVQSDLKEEKTKLRYELRDKEAEKKDSEGRLESATGEAMVNQIRECDKSIADLQKELETLKKSRALAEDGVENQKLVGNFDRRFALAKIEFSEAPRKSSSKEAELKNKIGRCKELESMCHELPHEPESVTKQEVPSVKVEKKEKQPLRTEREITAASEKLAECQETILHLGKQLKALDNTKEASLVDKVISTPTDKANTAIVTAVTNPTSLSPKKELTTQRSSLLDQMMAEDNVEKAKDTKSRKANGKEVNPSSTLIYNETIEALEQILLSDVRRNRDDGANSFAIVPRKKEGVKGLWKKLLWRKKKGNSKKLPLPFAT